MAGDVAAADQPVDMAARPTVMDWNFGDLLDATAANVPGDRPARCRRGYSEPSGPVVEEERWRRSCTMPRCC